MRKKIFTFLLALVTSVGLLNAQSGGISVTQFDVPDEWESAETKLLVSDLPGFGAADPYTTQRWNEVPSTGFVYLIYAFESDGRVKYHTFSDGVRYSSPTEIIGKDEIYYSGATIYYTTGPSNWGPEELPQVSEITNPPSEWYQDYTDISTEEMPGFVTVDDEIVKAWDAVPQGSAIVISSVGSEFKYHTFTDGVYQYTMDHSLTRTNVYYNTTKGVRFFYTTGTIPGGSTPTPSGDGGKLPGAFSINSDGDYIAFSKGNLQYHCTNHVWQFATNQYDIIGGDNANISDSYAGWIDLFGYGTGNNPTLTITNYSAFSTFTDWGVNAISNGGNEANLWRTLTRDEWAYLFNSRTNASSKYGMATVANVPGVIVLPDVYEGSAINTNHDGWGNNIISSGDWAAYETAGAVFLPVAGYREGTTVDNLGSYGFYWSSTPDDAMFSYKFSLDQYVVSQGFGLRYQGLSVRLVQATSAPSSGSEPEPTEDAIVIVTKTQQSSYTQSTVTISCAAIGDSDGFTVSIYGDKTATITNSDASKIISKIELVPGYSESYHSYVRANGETPASSSESLITFTNVNSNNVTLSITNEYIQIKEVRITLADNGGSTPAVDPTPTPSATGGIFANCYDCWRAPEYPTISGQCRLYNFGNPYVGNNNPSGPWKLEFVGNYDSSSSEYDSNIVGNYAASQYGKTPEQMEVYRLYQWQNGAYQPVAYGVLYAYANESNPVEHAAFFEAGGHWGCYFTDNTHSGGDDFNITFNEDASTGFADLHGSTPTPTPTPSGDGDKLAGAFSVSGTKVVYFSKGNLQATTSDQGATWTWGFAENQWDYVGDNAANTSFDYYGGTGNGSYDLFGWIGASSALTDYRQYGIGSNYDFTDCGHTAGEDLKADWGSLMGSEWRTLTYDEWQYLIKSRNNAANLLAYATVNGKTGLILLPDSWASSSVALTITTANYTTNIISASDWSTLEEQGCVFLPAAGWRSDDSVSGVGEGGDYWSSSSPSGKQYDEGSAYCFFFDTDFSKQADGMHFNKRGRGYGLSVRLVSETAPSGGSTSAGLQVTKLEVPGSWEGDNTLVTISDLPGFVAVSLEEAGAWDAVPTGDVVLIYAGTNEGVTATYFHNGAWGDPVPFGGFSRANIFEWASGSKIFYTSGGATPAVDPAVQNVIALINAIPNQVAYNDECKDAIDAARAAYDALNADQKALVSNYSTLTDAEAAYAALIPVVTNYSISLDGITENADKVTISAASAEEGATVTLTPAEGYQITAFTASYASAYSVRVTADPSVDVYEATPYVGALPKEFTENVTPGLNGATFHSIEGNDPFTPVPASVLEYVGMNAAKDQMTIRVNDAFSGIIRVNYTYNVETCEWDDYSQQEICMGGTAQASVRVVCEAAGGVAPASKDAVTGAYSFTMPAGNVTITATVEAIPAPAPTAAVIGDPNNASEVETFLTTYDGQTIDELIIDRPVLNNMYNTLCLPFDMNATQIAASSLNGVEIREFTGASVEGTTLNLSVGDPVNAVVAGRPYFVKFSAASQLDDLHFEDVTINNALLDNMAVTFDGVTFKGTFTPFVMPNGLNFQGGYLFLGQNNQLFWPNTSNPLKPFRAYFYVDVESSTPGNAPKYRGMPARIVEGKNVTTGVENAQSANQSTKVIVNGQLIIIKNDVHYNAQGQIVK